MREIRAGSSSDRLTLLVRGAMARTDQADTIFLGNGDRMTGKIVSAGGSKITITAARPIEDAALHLAYHRDTLRVDEQVKMLHDLMIMPSAQDTRDFWRRAMAACVSRSPRQCFPSFG